MRSSTPAAEPDMTVSRSAAVVEWRSGPPSTRYTATAGVPSGMVPKSARWLARGVLDQRSGVRGTGRVAPAVGAHDDRVDRQHSGHGGQLARCQFRSLDALIELTQQRGRRGGRGGARIDEPDRPIEERVRDGLVGRAPCVGGARERRQFEDVVRGVDRVHIVGCLLPVLRYAVRNGSGTIERGAPEERQRADHDQRHDADPCDVGRPSGRAGRTGGRRPRRRSIRPARTGARRGSRG